MATTTSNHREQQEEAQGNFAADIAIGFSSRAVANPAFTRWLPTQDVDVAHVLNVVRPIAEHCVTIHGNSFEFAEDGARGAVRAMVHVARGDDGETRADLIAWTAARPQTMC